MVKQYLRACPPQCEFFLKRKSNTLCNECPSKFRFQDYTSTLSGTSFQMSKPWTPLSYSMSCGRAIAQTVSPRLPTAAAHVRALYVMWDLWRTKWHWGMLSPNNSNSPTNSHSTGCTTFTIYHPGLVQ
jgi:hypothetical protein